MHYHFKSIIFIYAKNFIAVAANAEILNSAKSGPLCIKLQKKSV